MPRSPPTGCGVYGGVKVEENEKFGAVQQWTSLMGAGEYKQPAPVPPGDRELEGAGAKPASRALALEARRDTERDGAQSPTGAFK